MNKEPTPEQIALERKRENAAQYLRSRGIHRADAHCGHRYEACTHMPPPPRLDVSPSSRIQQHYTGE